MLPITEMQPQCFPDICFIPTMMSTQVPTTESWATQCKETIPGIMLKMPSFLDFINTKSRGKSRASVENRESGTGDVSWLLARIPEEERRKVEKPPGP